MEKRSGVHNIEKAYFVTISKLASKIIENKMEHEIVNSDSMRGGLERTPLCSEKVWKEIGWESKESIDYGFEGMQNEH
jgi:hypothetical protein